MGLTWYAFNNTKKQYVEPINGWKAWEIIANFPGMCEVVMMLMCYNWKGDRVEMEADPYEDYDTRLKDYENITNDAISWYNDEFIKPWIRAAIFSTSEDYIRVWERYFILDGKQYPKTLANFMESVERYSKHLLEKVVINEEQNGQVK